MYALFNHLVPNISFTCKRYFSAEADIQEAVQETMIKVFANLDKYDDKKGDLKSWVYRLSVNESLRLIKKNTRFSYDELNEEVIDVQFEINESLEDQEILELINELEGNYRLVFNLYFIEGYSHKEIAESLNIKENTSRIFYHRAKKRLMEIYSNL